MGRPAATTTPYVPGIDGLRAFAVAAVFLYHAVGAPFSGGFLGVDVFFVISGYLITSGLVREWEAHSRIDVFAFWLRRARRLLPAAFLLILAVLAAVIVFAPADVHRTRSAALAAVGFVTNWHLVLGHAPYFETVGRPSPLQHLWSLAVEEQFYLLWPGLLYVMHRWLRPSLRLGAVVLLATASAANMYVLYKLGADPSRLYYGTDTHATALLIGAALALIPLPRIESARDLLRVDVVGVASLVGLLAAVVWFDESQAALYAGGFTLVALASAVVIVAATQSGTRVSWLLGSRPLRWLGTRSYGVYLWHWPVLILTSGEASLGSSGFPLVALQAVVILALAECSFRYVEQPVRSGALGRMLSGLWQLSADPSPRSLSLLASGVGSVSAVVLLLVMVTTAGAEQTATPFAPPAVRGVLVAPSPTPAPTEAPPIATPEATLESTVEPAPADALIASSVARTPAAEPVVAPPAPAERAGLNEPPVTAVGDSVMLGAAHELARAFGVIDLDAEAGRSAMDVIRLLRERQQAGRLGSLVIVQIGNNGALTAVQVEQLMQAVAQVPHVLVMNVRVDRPWEEPNGAVLASVLRKYPNAELVDWYAASAQHPEFFWDDQTHLRPEGAAVYAQLLASRAGRS